MTPPRPRVSFAIGQTGKPAAPITSDPAHWRKRGDKLRAAGDRIGAAKAYARYLAAPIHNPALRAAAAALSGGRLEVAERQLRTILAGDPGNLLAGRLLGLVALRSEVFNEAERIFRNLLALAPGFLPLRADLAQTLLGQGKAREALDEAKQLLHADPRNVAFRSMQAEALGRVGDFAAAAALYGTLADEQPGQPALHVAHGHMLRTLRRRDEAIAAFRRAVDTAPHHGEAWWNLANMKTGALTIDDVARIRAALASDAPSADDRYHLRFALSRALEDAGEFGPAFEEYKRANAARAERLPKRNTLPSDRVDRTIALFTRDFLDRHGGQGDPSIDPIFILGMPRSGSTLLEQILASHPLIEGTQELADIPIIARVLDRGAAGTGGNAYPEILASLSPERLRALGADYLDRARAKRKTDRPFFIDKQPVNWIHAGFIRLILPNARIIEMRRDPLACCLSMFRQHFARGAGFTYSIERLAREYRDYHRLMSHFETVMPGAIRRMELGSLQAGLEDEARDLLAFLGLPFAPECLRFFESDRAVFTPSSEQVRRPINRDAENVLRQFAPHIGELRAALGDLAD